MEILAFIFISILTHYGSCNVENVGNPKNIILVITDGMSSESVTAARVHEAFLLKNSSHLLSFESFPHQGLLKTYDGNFKPGNTTSGLLALFYGMYNLSQNIPIETKTLMMSARKSKKAVGLVSTIDLKNFPATFRSVGCSISLIKCLGNARHNCSDTSCQIINGCLESDMDIIIGKKSGPVDFQDRGCDCLYMGPKENKNGWVRKTSNIKYVNSTEEFEKLLVHEGVKIFGLFSEHDLMKNYSDEKVGKFHLLNVMEKSIKILSSNPNGYFMVIMISSDDVVSNVKLASELSRSIRNVTSMRDTLLIVTSDSSSPLMLPTTTHNSDNVVRKNNCAYNSTCAYWDVPIYALGPYPENWPQVQDQADFGVKLMKLLEAKHYEDITVESEIDKLDSDTFRNDIKMAMAEIDEMTKEVFKSWL